MESFCYKAHTPKYGYFHTIYQSGKNHSLTIWTFVGKSMSPLSNTLSRFVIAFLPRNVFYVATVTVHRVSVALGKVVVFCKLCIYQFFKWLEQVHIFDSYWAKLCYWKAIQLCSICEKKYFWVVTINLTWLKYSGTRYM